MIQFFFTLWRFIAAIRRGLEDEEFQALSFLVLVVLLSGTLFYHNVEGMSWIDAFYFCAITLTTIGYGDITPQTVVGKLFTVVYIFVGLGLLAGFINVVAKQAVEQQRDIGFTGGRLNRRKPGSD